MQSPRFTHPADAAASHPPTRDTRAWQFQVWVSFAVSIVLCAVGLAYLPGQPMDVAFMVMGYGFCLTTAFGLAKFVRDNQVRRSDTPLWSLVVWGGFGLAMLLTGWGLWQMAIADGYKAYLSVGWLYMITNTFSLAKMLRDRFEADQADAHAAAL